MTNSQRIVVDPITRIEGHLRIEAEMGEAGKIVRASAAGTSVRGVEVILSDRDPRDVWVHAQRICGGGCTVSHAVASIRAVEDALHVSVPHNAQLIRNLMIGTQFIHNHITHFYRRQVLDWVDLLSALKADPKATAQWAENISHWPKSSPGYFADTQKKIKGFIESGQLGIFANGFWGHPAYQLPPELNLLVVAHYLEAIAWQRDVVKLHTIFGGKNPHPNFVMGGVPCAINLSGEDATAVNMAGLQIVQDMIHQMQAFVEQVYLPDTLAIAGFYKDWAARGEGIGNFLCFGDMPTKEAGTQDSFFFPQGIILNRDISTIHPIDLKNATEIQEFVAHSWYKYSVGDGHGLHPYEGETNLHYTGPKPPYEYLDVNAKYSWIKSPRWQGKPVEVGPLARVLMLYAKGHEPTKEIVHDTLEKLSFGLDAFFSTLGRTVARALESKLLAEEMQHWFGALMINIHAGNLRTFQRDQWDPSTWPQETRGVGFTESPRGALAHWVVIQEGRIANYQTVASGTWNAGPRDTTGQSGACEAALQHNHTVADPKQPIEILRTVHSFDPCITCAAH